MTPLRRSPRRGSLRHDQAADRRRPSQDRWLISYADFITLLFAVFVVLYAASQANKKQGEVSESIDSAFSALSIFSGASRGAKNGAAVSDGSLNVVMGEEVLSPAKVKDDLNRLDRELQQTLSKQVAAHSVSIQMGRDGLSHQPARSRLFSPPAPRRLSPRHSTRCARSPPRSAARLTICASKATPTTFPSTPPNFNSNWELSTARATSIARTMLDLKAIPADRLSAAGYAEFHPVAGNDTAEGRAQNRRVDLVVMPRSNVNFSQAGPRRQAAPWRKIT